MSYWLKTKKSVSEDIWFGYCSYVSSSSGEESDAESDRSSGSFDEGSYDGRLGEIVYQCKDDEAIAQGAPGAQMYDQNIRET